MTKYIINLVLCVLLWSSSASLLAAPQSPSVAFYYGNEMPVDMLGQFDWAVVESANLSQTQFSRLQRHGTQAFAYVSLGEVEAWRSQAEEVPHSVLVARNEHWNSAVADLTQPEWADYIIEDRIRPLWQAGYRGLFLDTLDSYRLFAKEEAAATEQQDALVGLIRQIRQTFPGIKLILNRGFEVMDHVHEDVVGVAAESLYQRWDPSTRRYGEVPEDHQAYLLDQFERIRDRYQLPLIAIDYVPPNERDKARANARRIAEAGFIPWVSTPELNQMGVGLIEPLPRKALILYDKSRTEDNDMSSSYAHRYIAMPLEYLGYGAVYQDINEPLPSDLLHGRYAGVVSWFEDGLAQGERYEKWLLGQLEAGLRIAIFGEPGVEMSGSLGRYLGIRDVSPVEPQGLVVVNQDAMLGFEGMPSSPPRYQAGFSLLNDDLQAHLTLRDGKGSEFVPILTAPWGGVAAFPWIIQQAMPEQMRWILDPFAFLQQALQLPVMPIADATTENGSRYWMTQVDGDAFVSRGDFPGAPFTAEILLEEIFQKYRVPTTVSIIEGEIGPDGMYPELSNQLEPLARAIFRLPWVEIATHTHSHPFDWLKLEEGDLAGQGKTKAGFNYNLPIENYHFSLEREIAGTTRYINERLAPPGKQTTTVLWTGDAVPPEKALAIAERIGLKNINGGNTFVNNDNPTLLNVSPMLRPLGDYLQVYAPQINENVYTNDMTGPLWGYRRVIETYKLTDTPRRLKPIDIYYHFYSAASPAALNALDDVYRYVLTQQTLPVFASTYSEIAQNWYDLGIARRLDGGWQIRGATQTRTLRLPRAMGWPDMQRSQGVVGVREIDQGRYVALSGDDQATLHLSPQVPRTAHLRRANGRVTQWQRDRNGHLRLQLVASQVPLEVELGGIGACRVMAPQAQRSQTNAGGLLLRYRASESGPIEVNCEQ
ncbi:endo alpha-1,4 polygalactosaminidase [Vreelandella rituensis]|uniref:Glycoside-hydrolase family GH114 TIM-barrel domain-containing protein n=1 Tax=Vreelandella rituensis TaxID=2282306 RepID=A0A368UB62_9GAMM|nr:endo alpha-1,4 polygalactosaminidase [Halomonas rituensis]RCV92503.1 hypothetical protein DU506_07280 [Halomonas rituensis]